MAHPCMKPWVFPYSSVTHPRIWSCLSPASLSSFVSSLLSTVRHNWPSQLLREFPCNSTLAPLHTIRRPLKDCFPDGTMQRKRAGPVRDCFLHFCFLSGVISDTTYPLSRSLPPHVSSRSFLCFSFRDFDQFLTVHNDVIGVFSRHYPVGSLKSRFVSVLSTESNACSIVIQQNAVWMHE